MGIQFHKVQQGNLPVNVIGDHVYFTDTGRMYVSQANGSLKEIQDLTDLNNQIEDLSKQLNEFTVYKSLTDLGLTSTATFSEVASKMKSNSILITSEFGEDRPSTYGTVTVKKTNNTNRVEYTWTVSQIASYKTSMYVAHHHSNGGFSGWKQIATTETCIITLYNGYKNMDGIRPMTITKSGNTALLQGVIYGSTDQTIADLPIQTRPKQGLLATAYDINNHNMLRVDIRNDGGITFYSPPNSNAAIIFNIAFIID